MISENENQDISLSKTFRRLLITVACMPFVAIVGGTISFYFSHGAGRFIIAAAVVTGIACLVACLLLRISGRHLAKGEK